MLLQTIIILNYILQLVWIILQLGVAIFLLIKMIKTKRYNLVPLILFFVINSIRFFFLVIFPSFLIINLILIQFSNILLLIFTKLTFFKYRKSLFWLFLIILIIVRTIDLIIRINFGISIPMTYLLDESNLIFYYYILFSITISFLLSHFWLGIVALKYYKSLKSVNVEPWIKKRYQLIGLGSLIYGFSIILYFCIPYNVVGIFVYPNIIFMYGVLGFTIFYSLCMFIAWVMPRKLRLYFNKDFKIAIEKEYTENELLELINKELNNKHES